MTLARAAWLLAFGFTFSTVSFLSIRVWCLPWWYALPVNLSVGFAFGVMLRKWVG